MSLEAEIIEVTRPGDNINVLVVFRESGIELTRETMTFGVKDITSDSIIQDIKTRGLKIQSSRSGEFLAKSLIGQKIPVDAALIAGAPSA